MTYEEVYNAIVARMGQSVSSRCLDNLTRYAYNILRVTIISPKDCEIVINGICNAAVIGWEEL